MPKGAKMIPHIRTENLKNQTLSRGTYLYSPYMGVPPPPPRGGSMTAPSESPSREAMSLRWNFLGPKTMIRLTSCIIAPWNVRTMFEAGNTAQVTRRMKEMERYDLDILGVSVCR